MRHESIEKTLHEIRSKAEGIAGSAWQLRFKTPADEMAAEIQGLSSMISELNAAHDELIKHIEAKS